MNEKDTKSKYECFGKGIISNPTNVCGIYNEKYDKGACKDSRECEVAYENRDDKQIIKSNIHDYRLHYFCDHCKAYFSIDVKTEIENMVDIINKYNYYPHNCYEANDEGINMIVWGYNNPEDRTRTPNPIIGYTGTSLGAARIGRTQFNWEVRFIAKLEYIEQIGKR